MMPKAIDPLVVIPIVRELPRLDECIAALLGAGVSTTRVIVVADGGGQSAGHSRDKDGVLVVGTLRRRGYAAACNHGARVLLSGHELNKDAAKTPLLLLNDDAILGTGWRDLLRALNDPSVGAVSWTTTGPRGARRTYDSEQWGDSDYRQHAGPTLPGCAFALTVDRWDEVGGLDERFTMYGEETDLFRTLQARGLSLLEGGPPVWHEGEGSAGGRRIRTTWYGIRNPIWVAILHDNSATIARTIGVTAIDTLSFRQLADSTEPHRRRRRRASWAVRLALLIGAMLHTFFALPSLLRGRASRHTGRVTD